MDGVEGRIPFRGFETWYRSVGDGPGEPLLCLHGGPGSTLTCSATRGAGCSRWSTR